MGEHWEWCHVKYLSIPSGQSGVWGKKENAFRTAENISCHITHQSFSQGGKKCALHYLKVLGSRMELNSVTGTNHFALPVAGQCFCSCFLSLTIPYVAVTGNSMVTNNPVLYLSLLRKCGAELSREVSSAEKGPLRDPHGWRCPLTGGEVFSALLNGTNWIIQCLKIKNLGLNNQGLGLVCLPAEWLKSQGKWFLSSNSTFLWCYMFLVVWREELGMFSIQWSTSLSCASGFLGLCPCVQSWCAGCSAVGHSPQGRFRGPLSLSVRVSQPLPDLGF